MSGADVFRVVKSGEPVRFLKTTRSAAAVAGLRREVERTRWLTSRGVRAPEILGVEDLPDQMRLLTSAVAGSPADDSELPDELILDSLGRGLARLHAMATQHCPFDEGLNVRLARAASEVAAGKVDSTHFESRNRDAAPEDILKRLTAWQPAEDLVVVHGDATLSNLLVDRDGSVGFIDCGNAGCADRYVDLAVLAGEISERFGGGATARFLAAYNMSLWDADKARFYSDLYELF